MNEKFLTIKEVSELLQVKESWIRKQIYDRKIPFIKMSGLIRFSEDAIHKWIEKNKKLGAVKK